MARSELPAAIADCLVKGMVVPETATQIRKTIYGHGSLTAADMDLVFDVARKAGANPCEEWTQLFSEAVTDYVVHESDPENYISNDKAQWLVQQLQKGGGISTKAEFAMLLDVMNTALDVPPSLSAFGLSEIQTAIVKGRRDAFSDEDHPAGVVTKPDVEALRAVLFAATSGSACHITQEEAEALFDIAHATAKGKVDPSFDDLFARAIGNYLVATCMQVPSAAEALHREKWLDEREKLPGFFSRLFGSKSEMGFFDLLKTPLELADADMGKLEATDERARAESGKITDSEAEWVMAHLTRGGKLTTPELRLLKWLGAEASSLPAQLKAMIDRANSFAVRAAS
jgi:hypothetical protein